MLLRAQARAALRHGRPIAWLATVLHKLGVPGAPGAPKGVSVNTGRLAAVMCASGDFASGRRSRPGRQVAAELLGVSERTVERQWRLLERAGVAVRTVDGRWLSAAERGEVYGTEDEVNRWRDRQEWHLVIPDRPALVAHAAAVDEAYWAQLERRARQLLVDLSTGRARAVGRPGPPVSADDPVDNRQRLRESREQDHPGVVAVSGRVAPSTGVLGLYLGFPGPRSKFSRPKGRSRGGAASRPSSTRRDRPGNSDTARSSGVRGEPPGGVVLARQLVASGRFPWLRDAPRYLIGAVLNRLVGGSARWTVADVVEVAEARVRTATYTVPDRVDRPAAYLRWLLAEADPDEPPVTRRRERALVATAAARARAVDRAGEHDARAGGVSSATVAAAREAAARARAVGQGYAARARAADHAARAAAAAAAMSPPAPPIAESVGCLVCVGCGSEGPDVAVRPMPVPLPECDGCWTVISAAGHIERGH